MQTKYSWNYFSTFLSKEKFINKINDNNNNDNKILRTEKKWAYGPFLACH